MAAAEALAQCFAPTFTIPIDCHIVPYLSCVMPTEVEKELSRSWFNTKPKAGMANLSGLAGGKVSENEVYIDWSIDEGGRI